MSSTVITTNHSTSYVALTRQTKSLSLFVSKDETPGERYLIQQMSRQDKKGLTLGFDTEKDIRRKLEDKTLSTQIRDKAESLITKVKDTFHTNPNFYKVDQNPSSLKEEVTVRSQEINPALQAVYKEMDHPAFTTHQSFIVKKAFEKGLKVHGEEKAMAYWEESKGALLQPYRDNLAKVENELNSPAFASRSEKWKSQARDLAKQDPLKVLDSFQKLQESAQNLEKQSLKPEPVSSTQQHMKQKNIEDTYLRFKNLTDSLKHNPGSQPSLKDLKHLAQKFSQSKDFMKVLKQNEVQEAKLIETLAQDKTHKISLEWDRGGLSL